jgi:hypothetical protein
MRCGTLLKSNRSQRAKGIQRFRDDFRLLPVNRWDDQSENASRDFSLNKSLLSLRIVSQSIAHGCRLGVCLRIRNYMSQGFLLIVRGYFWTDRVLILRCGVEAPGI